MKDKAKETAVAVETPVEKFKPEKYAYEIPNDNPLTARLKDI